MSTFFIDYADGEATRGIEVRASTMEDALAQVAAAEWGLTFSGRTLALERISRVKTRGVKYETWRG